MKKYLNTAFMYAIFAMVAGVFFREFTKILGYTGLTTLSVIHTHYFAMGMLFFLVIALVEKNISFSEQKLEKPFFILYTIGLNMTAAMLVLRGVLQVLQTPLTKGMDAAISGIAGLGHIILGTGIVLFFLAAKRQLAAGDKK